MRMFKTLLAAALVVGLGSTAYAELQNVEVSGKIRIRGNWYDYDEFLGGETTFVEQRTRLGVKADFTDEVTAFIELDSYDIWGTDFRSNVITGFDGPGADSVNLYQAFIQADEMWGTPLRLRVGRQEISLGSEWLVGVNDASSLFWGLSFDALRLTYATDIFSVDAIAAKIGESFRGFTGDSDFYVLYGSYTGFEDISLDAYWMYVHDHKFLTAYDVKMHTIGLRGAGTLGAFDFEAEMAYQFGDAELDLPWRPFRRNLDLDYDAIGANLEVGYTFDMVWQPRVFLGAALFEGADNDARWWKQDNDLPFNRLFSNWEYSEFLGNTDESNLMIYRAGVGAMPTENIELLLAASYFRVDEAVPQPWWWWWRTNSKKLGLEVGLYADYHYTEDLTFRMGYSHFFSSGGMNAGHLVQGNGLIPFIGRDNDDFDYVFLETEIKF
jgi:hypothetical protein